METSLIPLLIVAYQRPDNVKLILETSYDSGVRIFYVSLDAPRTKSALSQNNNETIRKVLLTFARENPVQVYFREFSKNVGCGIAVLKACDWFFSENDLGVVLEDDCIPSEDFFKFMSLALENLSKSSDIMIASGTQRAPTDLFADLWHIDTYPVFWGWGTTASKWQTLAKAAFIQDYSTQSFKDFFNKERIYWGAGVRRVLEGYVDTWDTLISSVFFLNQYKSISPAKSLIKNIGNDVYATHEMGYLDSENYSISNFSQPDDSPVFQPEINSKIGKSLYNIKYRHLVSTRVTKLFDGFRTSSSTNKPFQDRYVESSRFYGPIVKVG
jgi:hypothetical protein